MSIKACRTIATLLLVFVSVAMGQYAHANTNVGGNITANTTWSVEGSPYIVTSTVQVLEGVKLTIEPGVEIRFDPDTDLNVDGELIAIGTQSQMITFTDNGTSVKYAFLRFFANAAGASFDANQNYISGCIVKFCKFEIQIGILSEISLFIDANEFLGKGYTTITLNSKQGSVVANNTFISSGYEHGVAIDVESNNFIRNNTIDNYGYGIIAWSYNDISKNIIKNCHHAIQVYLENAIKYNTITKCGYSLDPSQIIVLRGNNTTFQHNTVVGNLVNPNGYSGDFWAIQISDNASGMVIEYNDIFNNHCKYEIKNRSSSDINAKYNFWGTTDASSIAEKIYDYYDYMAFGKVIFEPFATQPNIITTPLPDIKANNQDSPITVSSGSPVSITVSLNPNSYVNQNADWWVAESTPSGTFNYYNLSTGSMVPGLLPTHQGPLFNLGTTQLLNSSDLTVGTHTFYFAVDMNMNGSLDMDSIYYDSINVIVQ